MNKSVPVQPALRAMARALLCAGGALFAQPVLAAEEDAAEGPTREAREIVVQADIGFRNRVEDGVEPKLVYDEEYFRRF